MPLHSFSLIFTHPKGLLMLYNAKKFQKKIYFKSRDIKNPCLVQIPSQKKSKQGKIRGVQLLGAPSFFFCHGPPTKGAQYVP